LILLKATKNAVAVEGMRNAHMKDAVALCDFISHLQEQVSNSIFEFSLYEFVSISLWICPFKGARG
jgi:Xaa-Pro aminopeptidase